MGLEELAVILMTNLLECYLWNLFMRNFFDYRSMPILTRNMARFGIVAVMSLINLVGSPPLNLAGILTVYTAAAYILFEGNRGRLFYFNILETLLLLFCEDVVVSLGGNSEGAFLILDITAGKIAMLMVAKLFSLLLVYLVIRLMQGKLKNKEASVPLPFLLCPVLSIMLIRVVWQVTIYSTAEISAGERLMLIIICMLVAVFNIVILEIYNRNVQMQSQIMEQRLMQLRVRMESENYTQLEQVTQNYRQILHDINRYLNTLNYLACENRNEKMQEIVRDICADISKAEETRYSSNGILNFILNEKKRRADELSIRMDILAEPGFYCGEIRDYDCISILSNLLDNSLEAAEKCGDENRYVALHLFMDTDRNYAVIRLENGCVRMPVYDRGGFRTGKENKTRHGFGIKHVKELVAANKGLIDFEVQENRFTVTVCLPV